ncbi:Uncharacterised protein [Serratia quinivorans]|uniref:Lipoprotein n=1 Tax=Serratia quinivorans TaxID=137545 RepID=A0ABV3UML0_9GAMM|nr:hypothetical protein [Serratia quinivorans]CAI1994989.1 Uncharacterised protein [Serratia quinivorans]
MKNFNYTYLLFVPMTLLSPLSFAQQPETDSTQQLIDQAQRPPFTQGVLPAANHTAVTAEKSQPQPEHRLLPIWGDEARARGYDLPEPFGIGVNYMNMRQNIEVDSINFTGLGWDTFNLPSNLFKIDVGKTREQSKTETMRLDTWVLPFLNVYGIVGHTKGSSLSQVSVDADPSQHSEMMEKIIANVVHGMNKQGTLRDLDFKLDFKGTTYGAGATIVGGYDNWFASVDTNYTRTSFDILDGQISALTVSPRVGYRFLVPGIRGQSHLNLWVGTMYQDVQQEFKGSLSDLRMPAELQSLMALANQKGEGRFEVKQHLQSPWNVLVGTQYEITRNFNVLTEFGFSQRNSFMVSGEYRF